MNKKIMIIIAIVALAAGGYFFFIKGGDEPTEGEASTESGAHGENAWNPYSEEGAHIVTLSDMILSASEGRYIVKMTNTVKFASEDAYYKFKGYESKAAAVEALSADAGGHGGDEEHVTPMEIKINDIISDLMLRANENQIVDKKMLKAYLIEGINTQLHLEEPVVSDLYIENYVIQ